MRRLSVDAAAGLRDTGRAGRRRPAPPHPRHGAAAPGGRRLAPAVDARRAERPLGGQRGGAPGRRAAPDGRARRLRHHPAPRRADRLRQAQPPAGRPRAAAGADGDDQGRAGRADGVRQRDARADRGRHPGQGGHGHHGGGTGGPARRGAANHARALVLRGHGDLRGSARGDRAQRLRPGGRRGRALRLCRRRQVDRAEQRAGPRRVGSRPARGGRRAAARTARGAAGDPHAEPRRACSAALPPARADRRRPRLRRRGLLLRARHARRDPRRGAQPGPGHRPRRPAPAHAGADGSLPGLLLRRAGRPPAGRALAPDHRRALGTPVVTAAPSSGREQVDVAIVGGGPSGLAAATELGRAGAGTVVVLEREHEPGGIPRHARHQGFGLRDLRRVMSGPDYAARRAQLAAAAGAELRLGTHVTGWTADGALETTSPAGRRTVRARAVVLATGCRERPRSGRLVPGTRPQGVMTTGMLQQVVYLQGEAPGRRAVVVGAEHVSFSALLTLAHGGAAAAAILTAHPHHQTFLALRAGAALRFRAPLLTRAALTAIHGRRRVEGVRIADLDSGEQRDLRCDLVVFTADWIPDHELAVLGRLDLDPGTRGPSVDPALRTARPGVFAAGNVLHGAEPADVAALSGRHAAVGVLEHLAGRPWPHDRLAIECADPLDWIAPNALTALATGEPARRRFLLRARSELIWPAVELSQDGRPLWTGRLPRIMPGRSAGLPSGWTARADPLGAPIRARVLHARERPSWARARRRAGATSSAP